MSVDKYRFCQYADYSLTCRLAQRLLVDNILGSALKNPKYLRLFYRYCQYEDATLTCRLPHA